MFSARNDLFVDDLFERIEQEEEIIKNSTNSKDTLKSENFYCGIDLSIFDPDSSITSHGIPFKKNNDIDSLTLSLHNTSMSRTKENNHPMNVYNTNSYNGHHTAKVLKKSTQNNSYCPTAFFDTVQCYFDSNNIHISLNQNMPPDQLIFNIFFSLYKIGDVNSIEILYICSKNMGVRLTDHIFDILKVCRLSYDASLKLYEDIGDYTTFHPYFYDFVLKTAINLFFGSLKNFSEERFSIILKLFMAARFHKISLSGDVLRRLLEAISSSPRFDTIGIVFDYTIKNGITLSILKQSLVHFLKQPLIFDDIVPIMKDNYKSRSSDIVNDPYAWNELLICLNKLKDSYLSEDIFAFMISEKIPISIEALDSFFSLSFSYEKQIVLFEQALETIDLSVYVPFGKGAFSQLLWEYFTKVIEISNPVSIIPLFPYLIRIDHSLAERRVLENLYRQILALNLDSSIVCRVKGFIQHFNLF